MKKIMNNIGYKLSFLCFCMLAGVYAYAQEETSTDTLTSADYHVQMPKHLDPFYNGPLRFVVMGVTIAILLYITYRYWSTNNVRKDIWHDAQ